MSDINEVIAEKWSDYFYYKKEKQADDHCNFNEATMFLVPGITDFDKEDVDTMIKIYKELTEERRKKDD